MDDFAGNLDYLNDVRDAQMFQRDPRRKFERLESFEYYGDAEFVDRVLFTKEEIHSYPCEMITLLEKKGCQKRWKLNFLTYHAYTAIGKESRIRWFEVRYANAPHLSMSHLQKGCGGDTMGIRPTKVTSPEHFFNFHRFMTSTFSIDPVLSICAKRHVR